MSEAVNSIVVREDLSPLRQEKKETLTPRDEYLNLANEDYTAREHVFDANLSVTRRLHSMASKLWGYFSSPDQEVRAKAEAHFTPEKIKSIFENNKGLIELKTARDEAQAEAAVAFINERNFVKVKPIEKKRINEEVKVGKVKGIVDNMISAKAKWINLHFDGDPKNKEIAAEMNQLNTFQQDSRDKLREVYGEGQAYFDYKTNELQKTMLEGRLHEYFGTADSVSRGNMALVLSTVLDYPSYNLLNIMGNSELSIEEKVAEAMKFNKQDRNMEFLKTQIKPEYLGVNTSES